jgi:hypothetical protein
LNNAFRVNEEEYELLDKSFGKLCNLQAWQLIKKNTRNNHTNDYEDFLQDLKMHLLIAGVYYKRQIYIEKSLQLVQKYTKKRTLKKVVDVLTDLWSNRKRHGANRQTFGPLQESLLDKLVEKVVPKKLQPSRNDMLDIEDPKFRTYCKSITWNCQKTQGKKITKEKPLRTGQVSISEFDYLQ